MKRLTLPTAVAALILGAVVGPAWRPVVVVGHSMEPTLHSRQFVWVDEYFYRSHSPKPGEVIVFKQGGKTCVKRVYRGPGGWVYFYGRAGDELLLVRPLARSIELASDGGGTLKKGYGCLQVPDDGVFVVGDNARDSEDSRIFGVVPLRQIIGKVRVGTNSSRLLACEISLQASRGRGKRLPFATVKASFFKTPGAEE